MSRLIRVLLIVLALTATSGCGLFGASARTITVMLPDSAGLFVGNDVGVLGVPIGTITALTPEGDSVRATLSITDSAIKIPAGAAAAVVSRSVAADRYVELTPAYKSGPTMPSGAVIPRDRTVTPVDFDRVLGSLAKVSSDLAADPDASHNLRDLLDASAQALSGHGGDMNSALRSLSAAVTDVNDNRENIVGTIQSMETLTHALATNESTVRGFIQNTAQAATLLANERSNIGGALTALSDSIDALNAFAKEHQAALQTDINLLTGTLNSTAESKRDLNEALDNLPLDGQNLLRAISNGRVRGQQYPETLVPVGAAIAGVCKSLPGNCNGLAITASPFGILGVLAGLAGGH